MIDYFTDILSRATVRGFCLLWQGLAVAILMPSLMACKSSPALIPALLPTMNTPVNYPHERWSVEVKAGYESSLSPAIVDEAVLVAGTDGTLSKYHHSGRKDWQVQVPLGIHAGVAANGQVVVVGSADGELRAYSVDSGALKWSQALHLPWIGPALITDKAVIARTTDGLIYSFDINTGRRQWFVVRPVGALSVRSHQSMTLSGNLVIVGGAMGSLFALNVDTGALTWETLLSRPTGFSEVERLNDIVNTPIVTDGKVCAVVFQGKTACVEATTGKLLWQADIGGRSGVAAFGDVLVVADMQDKLYALKLQDGSMVWSHENLRFRALAPMVSTKLGILMGDGLGYMLWVHPYTGEILSVVSAGSTIPNAHLPYNKTNPRYLGLAPAVEGGNIAVQNRLGNMLFLSTPSSY